MISLFVDVFLLVLLVLIAVMVVRSSKLYAVIVMSGAYSLTSAAIFVNLDAVDVAFTEAAVGGWHFNHPFSCCHGICPS